MPRSSYREVIDLEGLQHRLFGAGGAHRVGEAVRSAFDGDLGDDAAGAGAHHIDAVGEEHRLADVVGNQYRGLGAEAPGAAGNDGRSHRESHSGEQQQATLDG